MSLVAIVVHSDIVLDRIYDLVDVLVVDWDCSLLNFKLDLIHDLVLNMFRLTLYSAQNVFVARLICLQVSWVSRNHVCGVYYTVLDLVCVCEILKTLRTQRL